MLRRLSSAAFLALLVLVGSAPGGTAASSRPTYACFSAQNAATIGRLGANDPSVRYGFEAGECLALSPAAPISDVSREGALWRFRAFGARPYLYAADWGAGFAPGTQGGPVGFEQYLPVTANLLVSGQRFVECYDSYENLATRYDDHDRRWRAYWARSQKPNGPVAIVYFADTGPKLWAERRQLINESEALDQRCSAVTASETSREFLDFMRSRRFA